MAFSKNFPKTTDKSVYPKWVEIFLTDAEEKEVEKLHRLENINLFAQCIDDAKKIFEKKELKDFQTDVINTAISLFEKRASHLVFWKESKCKEKFDEENK